MKNEPTSRSASSAEADLSRAHDALKNGDTAEARAAARAALAADPDNERVARLLLSADKQETREAWRRRNLDSPEGLQLQAMLLWWIAVLLVCLSLYFGYNAAQLGPDGQMRFPTKGGGETTVSGREAWVYCALILAAAVAAAVYGTYYARRKPR